MVSASSSRSFTISHCITRFLPYMMSLVLVQTYNGCLLSYLTVEDLTPPFKNLNEIVQDGRYRLMVERISFLVHYFNVRFLVFMACKSIVRKHVTLFLISGKRRRFRNSHKKKASLSSCGRHARFV